MVTKVNTIVLNKRPRYKALKRDGCVSLVISLSNKKCKLACLKNANGTSDSFAIWVITTVLEPPN